MVLFRQTFLEKIRSKPISFLCLNGAQFLGALNDNIYKFLIIFFLIHTLGETHSSFILSAAGALYVIPFLLFSSAAGVLADKFSKQEMIVSLKIAEVVLMTASFLAFHLKSVGGCYILLFLLATHSAIFGPSKYGIIPELVEKDAIPKANGWITAFTYLAAILGTFLASFFTEFTNRNYVFSVFFCFLFSLCGFVFSLGIRKTASQKSETKVRLFFLKEIWDVLQECRKEPFLVPSIIGAGFFLLVGAFTQLNIVSFAMQSLHLSEYAGGYLFPLAACGIAIGSVLCGKLLKNEANIPLSCLCGFMIGVLFVFLWAFSFSLIFTMLFLSLLGLAGGIFVVPLNSFIQIKSPPQKRGQALAAANFLSFVGVLFASLFLYLFGICKISSSQGFLCIGVLTVVFTLWLSWSCLPITLPFFSRLFGKTKTPKNNDSVYCFIAEKWSFSLMWQAACFSTSCQIAICIKEKKDFPFLLRYVPYVLIYPDDLSLEECIERAKRQQRKDHTLYVFHPKAALLESSSAVKRLFSFSPKEIGLLSLEEKTHKLLVEKKELF